MFGLPPATLLLLCIHGVAGATCVYFGLTLKRSFKWVLLLVGCVELAGFAMVAVGALTMAR